MFKFKHKLYNKINLLIISCLIFSFSLVSKTTFAKDCGCPKYKQAAKQEHMLMKRFFTPEVKQKLQGIKSSSGFTIDDVIKSGQVNSDGSIGVYAGDADSYDKFALLFNPIIKTYHKYDPEQNLNKSDLDYKKLEKLPVLDKSGKYIISTRIRVGRNIDGYALSPAISMQDRKTVETNTKNVLKTFKGKLQGTYYPLDNMKEEDRIKLVKDHFLFKKGDRFLEAAGANRDWPHNRGIFLAKDKKFLTWINEEDHLRIISMEKGGDVYSVFKRLVDAVNLMQKDLKFQYNDRLGYISSCPTNLGTAMRASMHVKLPLISQSKDFKKICEDLGLSVRGIHGEHSDSEGGVYDLSNKRRLGISEVGAVETLYHGVDKLIKMEKDLEQQQA